MAKPLTVVLPIHNQERQVRRLVSDVLELGHVTRSHVEIVVVDDGSTDETFETACEVARTFPQLSVFRQSVRRGLSAALALVRHRMPIEQVIVHDGVSPIDMNQLKQLLEDEECGASIVRSEMQSSAVDSCGSRRFSSIRLLHNSLEQAHRSVLGFCWMRLDNQLVPRRRQDQSRLSQAAGPTSRSMESTALETSEST